VDLAAHAAPTKSSVQCLAAPSRSGWTCAEIDSTLPLGARVFRRARHEGSGDQTRAFTFPTGAIYFVGAGGRDDEAKMHAGLRPGLRARRRPEREADANDAAGCAACFVVVRGDDDEVERSRGGDFVRSKRSAMSVDMPTSARAVRVECPIV
jgi:hypothetical protein